jgi:hypothetical protein
MKTLLVIAISVVAATLTESSESSGANFRSVLCTQESSVCAGKVASTQDSRA